LYGHLSKDLGLVMMLQILNPLPSFIILMYLRCSIRGREVRRAAGKREKREGGERETALRQKRES
jgi:hypothetical protein